MLASLKCEIGQEQRQRVAANPPIWANWSMERLFTAILLHIQLHEVITYV